VLRTRCLFKWAFFLYVPISRIYIGLKCNSLPESIINKFKSDENLKTASSSISVRNIIENYEISIGNIDTNEESADVI